MLLVAAMGFLGACSNTDVVAPSSALAPTNSSSRSVAPGTGGVLILDATVYNGTNSPEAVAARDLGFGVTVVNTATWNAMSADDFAQYRAVILGDPYCGYPASRAPQLTNGSVWGPAINGNVFIIGSDPVDHGKTLVTQKGIAFATAAAGKTGAYITASCYYNGAAANTAVPWLNGLSALGNFTATGVSGCFDAAHKVADHPALTGLDDAYLSNWHCSVHEGFDHWPSDFSVLAIASGQGNFFTASDGTFGVPYILARGEGLVIKSDVQLTPATVSLNVNASQTLTATVVSNAVPVADAAVTFTIVDGPNAGRTATANTDGNGVATFTYSSSLVGTDGITAKFVDAANHTQTSGRAAVTWTVPADATPPTITHTISGTPNAAGWYNSDVTVTFTATDGESAVTTTGCTTQNVTTTTSADGVTFTCVATSTGGSATDAVTIKLDKTVPTVTGVVSSGTLVNGWYTDNVVVTWTPSAPGPSGQTPSADCGNVTLTTDTPSHTFTCTVTTGAGLSSAQGSVTVKRDAQTPQIHYTLTGAMGSNGWYVGDVGVVWTTTAGPSGVNTCVSAPVTTDGTGITFSCTATAGNGKSASLTTTPAQRDATKPVVTYAGNAGSYTVDQTVAITCSASDNLSGVASTTCAPVSGAAYTFLIGANSYSATALDRAGNANGAGTTFTVGVTQGSLCALAQRWVSNAGVANSFCVKINGGDYQALRNELSAQSGKKISADNAATLLRLINVLDPQ
jgi:hypothetical protein